MLKSEESHANASIFITSEGDLINILWRSLKPESERPPSSRSRISLDLQDSTLNLMVSTTDITALRSTLNSYLRWVKSITDVLDKAAIAEKCDNYKDLLEA